MAESKAQNRSYRVAGEFTSLQITIMIAAMTDALLPVNSRNLYKILSPTPQAVAEGLRTGQKFNLVICRLDNAWMTNNEKTRLYYYLHGALIGAQLNEGTG